MERFNIYYRKCDNRWEGRIVLGKRLNGNRHYQYVFGHSKEEVKSKIQKIRAKKTSNKSCNKTFYILYTEWFKSICHKIKESTSANYKLKANKHILPCFEHLLMENITSEYIHNFIEQKKKEGLSIRYIADIIVLMKSVFKYAVKVYGIPNIMEFINLPIAIHEITKTIQQKKTTLRNQQKKRMKKHI